MSPGGKLLYTADALSQAPKASTKSSSTSWQDEAELLVEAVIADLPAYGRRGGHGPPPTDVIKVYIHVHPPLAELVESGQHPLPTG